MIKIISSLGWPHVALIFAVFFTLVFWKPIAKFISNIKSIDKSGIKIAPNPDAQREEKERRQEAVQQEAVQELLDVIGESPVLSNIENAIKSDLESRELDTKGDTIKVLIKHLAASKILAEFERIHNFIFGSQIRLLKDLNEIRPQGRAEETLQEYWEGVKIAFPEATLKTWDSKKYLEFLVGSGLIIVLNKIYHITPLGIEFLTWMSRNGRPENKAL
ncbi:MAG: hypothetical protein OXU34_02350 [Gammaproteobacteria bacterium]|nr:hypothetical protein [Gammaproteobacteria bacterium]